MVEAVAIWRDVVHSLSEVWERHIVSGICARREDYAGVVQTPAVDLVNAVVSDVADLDAVVRREPVLEELAPLLCVAGLPRRREGLEADAVGVERRTVRVR